MLPCDNLLSTLSLRITWACKDLLEAVMVT